MIQKFPFFFDPGGEARTIHVYLPNDYRESDERYPVVYMFDGQNLFRDEDATYGKSWGIARFLDQYPKGVIVVGMECSHHGHDRITEYCPYTIKARMTGLVHGQGEATMQWFIHRLKPYIDSHYRTWSHREATAIAGSSMGGMMALYAVIRHNEVFSKSAAVSPAIFGCTDDFLREIRRAHIHPDTRLFMSWGTEEDRRGWMTRRILRIESAMMATGASTWLYHHQGGSHCEACWEEEVPTWMEYLWK